MGPRTRPATNRGDTHAIHEQPRPQTRRTGRRHRQPAAGRRRPAGDRTARLCRPGPAERRQLVGQHRVPRRHHRRRGHARPRGRGRRGAHHGRAEHHRHPAVNTVRVELRVGETDTRTRGYRHLFVASPASGREVAVSDVDTAPHYTAAWLYLWDARDLLRYLAHTRRVPAADGHPDLWYFVATLELPDDRTTA